MDADFYDLDPSAGVTIDIPSKNYLYDTAKWGQILAIIGFIFAVLMLLMIFVMDTIMGHAFENAGTGANTAAGAAIATGVLSGLYIVIAILYFIPSLFLYKFSSKMKLGLRTDDQQSVTDAFKNLKSLFVFMGVLTIIGLLFYAFVIFAMILGAGAAAL